MMKQVARKKLQLSMEIQRIFILCYKIWMDGMVNEKSRLSSSELIRVSVRQHKHIFHFMTLKQKLQELQ